MAVATVPVLGSFTLPPPKEQGYKRFYRGGTLTMADGSIVHDLVDATARHTFSLRWEYRTSAELATITSAWDAIKNTTATYTSVRNTSHVVTQPDGANLEVTPVVTALGDLKFNISMELVEDS